MERHRLVRRREKQGRDGERVRKFNSRGCLTSVDAYLGLARVFEDKQLRSSKKR